MQFWHLVATVVIATLYSQSALAVPNGYLSYTVPLDASPVGLAFDPDGNLFALESPAGTDDESTANSATIRIIHPDNTFGSSLTVTRNAPGNFFIGGIAYDPVGSRLLVTDNTDFTTGGSLIYAIDPSGAQQTLASGITNIADIAVRSTGEIFVSTAQGSGGGEVLLIDPTTGSSTAVTSGLDFGAGLAFNAAGDLLIIESDSSSFLGRISRLEITETEVGLEFGNTRDPIADNLSSSFGIALDSEDDIFTTGSGGLFSLSGDPLSESSFLANGAPFQFATAIDFAAGSLPFEQDAGADAGRLAFSSNFSDAFVTFIRPTPPVDADFNDDTDVDQTDLGILEQNFGLITTASNTQGDANGDFQVNGVDFLLWQRQFSPTGSTPASTSVPEPNSMVLVMSCSLLSLLRRRRQSYCC